MQTLESLRQRMWLAAMGVGVTGCSGSELPEPSSHGPSASASGVALSATETSSSSNASLATPATTPVEPTSHAVEPPPSASAQSFPPAPPRRPVACPMGPSQEVCFTPFAGMRSKGTGEPAPVPPPSAFDTRGCLPLTEVSDGCCSPAKAGPRFASGKCCYETCPGSCCGRAFVVDDLARVAALEPVAGARAAPSVDAAALEAAQGWLADAQLEHASIASFARFTLELLSLGAPMDLVRRASEATLEEVRHAELCLVLAETLGAGAHRAGPLPQAAGLPARPLSEIVVAAIREGCVGETLAAIAAQRQLERAESAPARDVLTVIARDEARHAELGWAFVGWALRQEPGLLPLARHTFEQSLRAIEAAAPAATSSSPSRAARYGRLEPGEHDALSRQAVRSLLRPVSESLLRVAVGQPS